MFNKGQSLSIRGYAQIDYNQPISKNEYRNGKLEVHRFVLFTGYRFNDRLQFVTEIEVEHGDEIFIEQAYAQYKINRGMNLRAGMIVMPMGLMNEYHEPTTYHGVERPNVEGKVIPTTWRELALGLTGVLPSQNIRYQAYVTNGFLSHDGDGGVIRGKDGLRKGRQKGLRSTLSSPNFSTKVDYFGLRNLRLGLAGYFGKTQSRLYDGLNKSDDAAIAQADSSVVGMTMLGADLRYSNKGFEGRALYVYANFSNTDQYNAMTGKDFGSRMTGYYVEGAYDLLSLSSRKQKTALLPFVRYEQYNTHAETEGVEKNDAYDITEVTAGISWRHGQAVSFKMDYQWIKNGLDQKSNQLNAGVGVWF